VKRPYAPILDLGHVGAGDGRGAVLWTGPPVQATDIVVADGRPHCGKDETWR
jgi:hypothetical protein